MSLFGIGNRKLVTGEAEVRRFIDRCTQSGIDVFELCWTFFRKDTPCIVGLDEPIITKGGSTNFVATMDYTVNYNQDGILRFYPDEEDTCWGYLADTNRNREWLAGTLKNGWFKIVDGHARDEIKKLAIELNEPTEVIPTDALKGYLKKDPKEIELEKMIKKTQALEQELARMNNVVAQATELVKNKQLKGVHISTDHPEKVNA
jgi:hypothetical protein